MRLFHLLASHNAEAKTGVPRFSKYFAKAFPQVINIDLSKLPGIEWREDDVVVTDNHLSVRVPQRIQTIVVHHGCAPYHYEVEAAWRSPATEAMATAQRLMFHMKNRIFVAPSAKVAQVFKRYASAGYDPLILPHWVPLIPKIEKEPREHKIVIGDWRNENKGKSVIEVVRWAMMNESVIFAPLDFSGDEERIKAYQNADAYLCLSLSEGAPYSVADAEAAGLPIATTEVGNVFEYSNVWTIGDRSKVEQVRDAVLGATAAGKHMSPSFFERHTFDAWQAAWKVVIDEAEKRTK